MLNPAAVVVTNAAMSLLAHGLDNGLGRLPPMGYNTWNDLGRENLNEKNIKTIADVMASNGLLEAGYEYLNLDDGWMASVRDKAGRLQGDAQRFPSGMKSIADYVHSKGLKFGLYTSRGPLTCQSLPASGGNETLDAQTFADWGVDYLKEDDCFPEEGRKDLNHIFEDYGLMRDALNATGRPIFFSVCGGGAVMAGEPITFYASDPRGGGKLANSWRISGDVISWNSCQSACAIASALDKFSAPGGFNDPDMLFGSDKTWQMSQTRSRTAFNLLSILMAPLLLGANLRDLNAYDLETFTNAEVIAVNQDKLVKQGRRLANQTESGWPVKSIELWARELVGGRVAMVFMNDYGSAKTIVCDRSCWAQLPAKSGTQFSVRDLWSHDVAANGKAIAGEDYEVTIEDGDGTSKMLLFTPSQVVIV